MRNNKFFMLCYLKLWYLNLCYLKLCYYEIMLFEFITIMLFENLKKSHMLLKLMMSFSPLKNIRYSFEMKCENNFFSVNKVLRCLIFSKKNSAARKDFICKKSDFPKFSIIPPKKT